MRVSFAPDGNFFVWCKTGEADEAKAEATAEVTSPEKTDEAAVAAEQSPESEPYKPFEPWSEATDDDNVVVEDQGYDDGIPDT